MLYLVQPMLMPPVIMQFLRKSSLIRKNRTLSLGIEVAMVAFSSAVMTPLCIAMFDQQTSLPVNRLENSFRGMYRRPQVIDETVNGENANHKLLPVEYVTFNKGL